MNELNMFLTSGHVAVTRNGQKWLCIKGDLVNDDKMLNRNNYKKNLEHKISGFLDIMEIYKPDVSSISAMFRNCYKYNQVWERSSYVFPKNTPMGTRVFVRDSLDEDWKKKYFVKIEDNKELKYRGSYTGHWGNEKSYEDYGDRWKYCVVADSDEGRKILKEMEEKQHEHE